nr:MAG TPA: hypothetical protein [Bacteriophage sp.]
MHKWAKQIMECVKAKVEAIGLDNFEGQNLDDLKDFTEIAKNIACFDKDYRIVEAMEKSEDNEDIIRMVEQYEDYPDRRFYDNYRYANGRLAPKGRGTRRGYIEPLYFHQMPDDYRTWEDKPMQERMRDLDRMGGRMHYTEPITATRDSREGKSGMMRRSYIEAKEMHKDKDTTMQELEKYLKGVSEDITDVIGSMTPEERSMLKSKMSTLVTKL